MILQHAAASFIWLALNVYFEARDQPELGQEFVCQTVFNRVIQRKKGIIDIITESKQYSWYNGRYIPDIEEPQALIKSAGVVAKVWMKRNLFGKLADGVTHYHHKDIDPYWSHDRSMHYLTMIDDHMFYREER